MKFRAVLYDQQCMKDFQNTVLTLSKLTKECVMNISTDKIYIIINEESTSTGPLVWAELICAGYFDEYIMAGIDEGHPNILISFNPSNLSRALSVLRNSVTFVKIKLTNKQFPCLTVDIELPSVNTVQDRRVVHDVPVDVIPRRNWDSYTLPRLPPPELLLRLPSVRFIRNLMDKIKNFSPSITFCATGAGELSIIAETDSATVASHYRNLEIKSIDTTDTSGDPKSVEKSCLIDSKKTSIFLSALPTTNLELSCSVFHDYVVQLAVEIRHGFVITGIIPAVCI